ncbi:MAG: hypothetical protein HOQ09_06100, partial [Gemmatimonadaceae bacterium]|nr:hypothetical protein [Gemmatimonadaceae bacterium]
MRDSHRSLRRERGRRVVLATIVLATVVAGLSACRQHDRSGGDAVAIAQRFLTALDRKQWDSVAALVDSVEVQRFHDQQLMILAGLAEHEREIVKAMSATGSGGLASIGAVPPLDTALIARHRAWPV